MYIKVCRFFLEVCPLFRVSFSLSEVLYTVLPKRLVIRVNIISIPHGYM